ncbi:MAG TPA: capsular polysaccharide synthesis protein, partial [Cellvibrionaceae bacterium]|nr:capsular polysaccharide synthesis protein [Cellvibrionaceae bacterium]
MKFRLKHLLRIYCGFLRQTPPLFSGHVKHAIWGAAEQAAELPVIPNIIWLYWDAEQITSITAELCINLIKSLHPVFDVRLLNKITISDYLPDFPKELADKAPNFISDMVRLMLIEKYGGIYLDATVLLSKPIDWALKFQQDDRSEAVLYYTDENTVDEEFPMVESWFIVAPPNSKFIRAWREEYQNSITCADIDRYWRGCELLPQSKFPLRLPYYLCYWAAQRVLRKNQDYRLTLLRAEDDAFSYGLGFKKKWDEVAMADLMLFNKKPAPCPNLVKLIRYDRVRLDYYIQRKFYKKDSWLGELI